MILGAIADDLTGATDLSLILARNGMRVVQTIGLPDDLGAVAAEADAVVVALKSRTIPADEAVAMSLDAARALQAAGARRFFFKYCSTFDSTDEGNIGPVASALMSHFDMECSVACPSFPENGRTVYQGHLFVHDRLISDSPMKDHPLTPMRDPDLVRVLSRQTERPVHLVPLATMRGAPGAIAAQVTATPGIFILDAIDDSDLRAIARDLADLPLITGGSAVAMGLPDIYRARGWLSAAAAQAPFEAPAGKGVILAGSCSEMTRKQIDAARRAGLPMLQIDAEGIAEGRITAGTVVDFVEKAAGQGPLPPVVYSSADPGTVARAQKTLGRMRAGELVETLLGEVAASLAGRGFTRIVSAGGETSGAVAGALGASALRIGPEIDPGVPWVMTLDGERPLCLALKSGNFGSEDFFLKAWELLA